jgi:YidC/Oxa1 family membrane protein insertase
VYFFAANPLQPLIDLFESILKIFHDHVGFGWGLSIIVLTVCVRACLLPLTFKQFKSMQSLARHQPEIKKLQERYKGDKERLNQEMMKFYRENKVNPFASCLPLVAQLPVFLSLYYMLRKDLRIDICPEINPPGTKNPVPCGPGEDAGFLFIHDLTNKATGLVLVTLIVLYVGSQLASTLLMSTTTDRTQKMLFAAMPFFFVIFVIQFPAGLLLYWITTNCWTILQQAIVRKRLGPIRPPGSDPGPTLAEMFKRATNPEAATAGGGGKGSGGGKSARASGSAGSGAGTRKERPSRAGRSGGGAAKAGAKPAAGTGTGSGRTKGAAGSGSSASTGAEPATTSGDATGTSDGAGRSGQTKPKTRPTGPPPTPPRRKKKRSGRRR